MPRPVLTVLGTTGTAVGCAAMAASRTVRTTEPGELVEPVPEH